MTKIFRLNNIIQNKASIAFIIAVLSRIIYYFSAYFISVYIHLNKNLSNLLCIWDCGWYMSIVEHGYQPTIGVAPDTNYANWAFFPLFPEIVKIFSQLLSINQELCGTIISNIMFCIAAVMLYKYCAKFIDRKIALLTIAIMCVIPATIYYSSPYTESTYLLLMICTMYLAKSDNWLLAGLFGAALSATRNLGVTIVFPLFTIAIRQFGFLNLIKLKKGSERILLCLLVAPLGLFIYMFYLYKLMGDALAFKNIEIEWGRTICNPIFVLYNSIVHFSKYTLISSLICIFAIYGGYYLIRKKLIEDGLIILLGVLIPLSTSIVSINRYALTMYPTFIFMALLIKKMKYKKTLLSLLFIISETALYAWVNWKPFMV